MPAPRAVMPKWRHGGTHHVDQTQFKVPPGADSLQMPAGSAEEVELGRRIYIDGTGASGQPVVGLRFGGVEAQGKLVACVTCHRQSGLGSVEGSDQVPPIAGRFLFSDEPRALTNMSFRTRKSFNERHAALDMATFSDATRLGKHISGRELSPIMPRYELTDVEMKALAAYLRTLSLDWSPGVTGQRVRLATVITPGVSAARRKAFLDTIQAAVSQKNGSTVPGQRTMSASEMVLNTQRFWDLDIWELQGPAESWPAQLHAFYAKNPVFALVSGLGDETWEPVHKFCEGQRIPCWFPSVDLPPDQANNDFYAVYFSRGVKVEADVLAKQLLASAKPPKRVLQIHEGDEVGQAASQALSKALSSNEHTIKSEVRQLKQTNAAAINQALSGLGKHDVVMLWLHPQTLAELAQVNPPAGDVYVSAYMANGEKAPIPSAWKARVKLVYPFLLPEQRATGLVYFNYWLKSRGLPLVDEIMQSEVYFVMSYLSETMMDMMDNLHRDYLIERTENMLSLRESSKAEDEARDLSTAKHQVYSGSQAAMRRMSEVLDRKVTPRPMPGRMEHVHAKRESTTIYPRLSLAQGQRYASKGGQIVRYVDPNSDRLAAVSEWIVP